MRTKEQLIHFFISGHIHLSKKDYSFFSNLDSIIKESNKITTNQAKLFDKLVLKYQRQIKKEGHNPNSLVQLPWTTNIVETRQEFLDACIRLVDDKIIIKSPFNAKFVQSFRRTMGSHYVWDKDGKFYKLPFSTYNLKVSYNLLKINYETVKVCEKIQTLFDDINQYKEVKYWHPTLIKVHGNFYISCINESLFNATKHIDLNDDPNTLFELSVYGIKFDENIINKDPLLNFASSYNIRIDITELKDLCKMLSLLKVEHVFTNKDIVYRSQKKTLINELKLELLQHGITCGPLSSNSAKKGVFVKTIQSSDIEYDNITKIVTLLNSRPITIE